MPRYVIKNAKNLTHLVFSLKTNVLRGSLAHKRGLRMLQMRNALGLVVLAVFFSAPLAWSKECLNCHTKQVARSVVHAAAYSCEDCHLPHGQTNGNPRRLIDLPNALCANCHDSVHAGTVVQYHPTEGDADPLYPKKPFNCISCHNPHSSSMAVMFRYDYKAATPYRGTLCSVCHWKQYQNTPAPPTPPWQ